MVYWIKKFAAISGITVFFIILFAGLIGCDPFDPSVFVPALLKAAGGAALFWFAGFITGDIIFKGVLSDIDHDKVDLLEGGMLQKITEKQKSIVPGSPDMPFVDVKVTTEKETGKKGKKK